MKLKKIISKTAAFALTGMIGISAIAGLGSTVHAANETEKTPPASVDITIHKLMYDFSHKLDIDKEGIKNDGHSKDQLPEGVEKYSKADYGDVQFTISNITDLVFPAEDSELTNATIDEIVKDLETNGANSNYIKNSKNQITSSVDDNGEVTFGNLPGYVNDKQNVYAIFESKSAAGLIAQKAKPMVVAAPMTDSTGTAFLKTIQLYPKNITKKLEFNFTKYGDDGKEENKQSPLKDAKFEVYKGAAGEGKKLGAAMTDGDGKILVQDLTVGKYYLVEIPSNVVVGSDTNPTKDQYLLGADARNDKFNKLTFEITTDGTSSKLEGSYVNYKAPEIEKTVTNGVGEEHSFQVGDLVNYLGKVLVPTDIRGAEGISINGNKQTTSHYATFNWNDTAGKGLTYVPNKAALKVTNKDKSITLEEGTDYTLTNKENGFVVDFIMDKESGKKVSDTVAKLHGQELLLDYNMVVNETAVVNDPLTNSVQFIFNNNPNNEDEKRTLPAEAAVKTYGAKFLKVDSGWFGLGNKTPLEGAEFVAINSDKKFYAGQIDVDKDGVKEAVWTDKESEALILKSDKSGLFEIQGLAEGKYSLKETKAPEGYQKLLKDVEFTVNKDSFKEENRLTIKNNQKPGIAQTGSKRILIIGMISLVGVVGGTLIYLKKRKIA